MGNFLENWRKQSLIRTFIIRGYVRKRKASIGKEGLIYLDSVLKRHVEEWILRAKDKQIDKFRPTVMLSIDNAPSFRYHYDYSREKK